MASSSLPAPASLPSSSSRQWKYDVFLSFRGPDSRKSITSELYDQLQNKRAIKTFMDDQDIPLGAEISPTLLSAIEESRFAIVVLSKHYASSTWCLQELTKICECMKEDNRIIPIFYQVEPADVKFQINSFKEAFTKHENSGRHAPEKVEDWKAAIKTVGNVSGRNIKEYKTDKELVQTIVEEVCKRVGPLEIKMGDFEIFDVTRRAMDEVMKALEDDSVTAIGVYGMGGVGKTTLIKHVGAQARKNGIFDHVIMAAVSQSPNVSNIQGTLLADLLRKKKVQEFGRASELNEQILTRNKTLIILDDIWTWIELSSIGIPNQEELKRCKSKVLLTTRIENVCHGMRCQEKISLDILSVYDSWTLFVRNAGRSFESTEFENVARSVASECCGLPIALIAVAKALGDKDLVEWKKAAQRLEKSQLANPDERGEAFECIKLSYDYLRNEDYKSCFLLCCLFPEDDCIKVEDLFRYSFGMPRLFRDADTIEEARGTAVSVVKHLKSCSLLLDCEVEGCVKMHDVIRDTAIKIARSDGHSFFVKAGCGLEDWPLQLHEGDYYVVSLMWNNIRKLPKQLVCPKLQILLLPGNYNLKEIPETLFESLKDLRVLDLSSNSISFLSQSFSLPTNLRALYLDYCINGMDTSILENLKKLEILSMRHYPNKKLSAEIGQLTNLRMLDISGGRGIVTIPSKVISKLHRLEELYMFNCGFANWGSIVEGEGEETSIGFEDWGSTNIRLDELVGLSNLKILHIDIANAECIPEKVDVKPNWVDFYIRINMVYGETNHNSRYLGLRGGTTIATLPDWFVNAVAEKTEYLKYYECGNILKEFDYGRLNELKRLYLDDSYSLEPLEELCVGELPPESLSKLHVLHVENCTKLKNVSKFLQRLSNLEDLHLDQNDVIEYVFETTGFQPKQSKLREMRLFGLEALRSICNGPIQHTMFQNLKLLVIYRCYSLRSVFAFASDVAECLSQLEDLFVRSCRKLKCVIEASKEPAKNKKKIILPKLKSLFLSDLPELRSVSAITIDLDCPSLEHLYVLDCPLYSVPDPPQFQSKNQVQLNDEANYERLSLTAWRL